MLAAMLTSNCWNSASNIEVNIEVGSDVNIELLKAQKLLPEKQFLS